MQKTLRYLSTILLTATIVAPLTLSAMAAPQDDKRHEEKAKERYYDKHHKDYHDWDDREQSSFQIYLTENHRPVVEFRTLKVDDQQRYWDWRHEHPDHK